jgi:hypothetical protein
MLARRIGGVVAGVVVAILLVMGAEELVHRVYPPPAGANMHDMEVVKRFVASLPRPALLMVLGGWAAGTLAGTWLAARIGLSRGPGYVVGALLLAGGVANAAMIPQPAWFSAVSFAIYGSFTLLGTALAMRSLAAPSLQSAAR